MAPLILMGTLNPIYAASSKGAGSSSFPFLKIPVSARAAALGGTLGATDGDVASLDTNAAALLGMERTDIQLSHLNYFDEASLQSAFIGMPIRLKSKSQPPYERMNNIEFPENQIAVGIEYRAFKASDKAYSDDDHPLENFDVRDQLIEAGLAFPLNSKISLGLAGKLISSKIQGKSTSATAFDGGFLTKMNSRWSWGLAVQNLGSGKKYTGTLGSSEYSLPLTTRGHLAYRWNPRWLLLADLARSQDEILRKSGGVEWALTPILHFRGGISHHTNLEFSGGLGINIKGPQKYSGPVDRAPSSRSEGSSKSTILSPMTSQILGRLSDKLISAYLPTKLGQEKPTLIVLPFTSAQRVAQRLTKSLRDKFSQSNEFKVLDSKSESDFIVSGSVELADEKYAVNARMIRMEDGETIGLEHVEIAEEDLFENNGDSATPKKNTLEREEPIKRSKKSSELRANIGLDYGLATHQELGITHTITLKILY